MTTLKRWLVRLAVAALVLVTLVPVVGFEVLYRVSLAGVEPLPVPSPRQRLPSPFREAMIAAVGDDCASSPIYPWNRLPLLWPGSPDRTEAGRRTAGLLARTHIWAQVEGPKAQAATS